MLRTAFAFALAAVLAGCGTTSAQREMGRMKQAAAESAPALDACVARLRGSAPYQELAPKIALWDAAPSLAQQTDEATPSAADAAQLLSLHQGYLAPCRRLRLEMADRTVGAFVPILVDAYARQDAVYALVVGRKISWGDANLRLSEGRADAAARAEVVKQYVAGGLEQSHNAELARRQAATVALGNWLYQQQVLLQNQQLINAATRPQMTSCQYVGAMLSCTTF